jgi:L-lactate dehydrogenase complex protein LldG
MSSKKIILSKLNTQKPPTLRYQIPSTIYDNLLEVFNTNLQNAGGKLYINKEISHIYPKCKQIIDTTKSISYEEYDLEKTDLLILQGSFAIAQNGSIWIDTKDYPKELITLTKHIAVLLNKNHILSNMKEAYEQIDFTQISTGIFLSGPSKTADIEQALVIGAHGAISLSVIL